MSITLKRNTVVKSVEVLEAEELGNILAVLAEYVGTRKDNGDRSITLAVICKALMHENNIWDVLGHKMYSWDKIGRAGQQEFFKQVLRDNNIFPTKDALARRIARAEERSNA
tara:strand:+ start:125 stop:460 length:336 start_codon:yes stop_codon:yes gene_type:complete